MANGGFESADAQWTLNGAVICTELTCGRAPAGGERYFASSQVPEQSPAGVTEYQLGSVEQRVYVPELPATLSFDVRRTGGAPGTESFVRAFYRSEFLFEPELLEGTWQRVSVPLPEGSEDAAAAGLLQTTITKAPPKRTTKHRATFAFSSSEPGSTFRCRLDDQRWQACASPATERVSLGTHALRVRAKDPSGNVDPTAATHTWRVRRR